MRNSSLMAWIMTAFVGFLAAPYGIEARAAGLSAPGTLSRTFLKSALAMAAYDEICGWEYCKPSQLEPRRQFFGSRPRGYEEGAPGLREYGRTPGFARRSVRDWQAFVAQAARQFRIPVSWIRAVIHVESRGDVNATSPKGAMGLMQIMPATWAMLRNRYGLGDDPYHPIDNVYGGTAYLRELYDRYGAPGFLAAYNAGPERYEAYLTEGQPLPGETRNFVASVSREIAAGRTADYPSRASW